MLNRIIKNIKNKITGSAEEEVEPPIPYVYKKKKEEPVWDTVVHLDDDTKDQQQTVDEPLPSEEDTAEVETADKEQEPQTGKSSNKPKAAPRKRTKPAAKEKTKTALELLKTL